MLLERMTSDAGGRSPAYLVRSVATRETRRRRTLVWATVALSALSVAPVFAHHLERGKESALGSGSHIGEICLVAIHQVLAPVHTLFHIVLLVGLAYAIYDRVVYGRRTRLILSQLEAEVPTRGDVWWRAATAAGVDPSILRIVVGLPNPAFTVGWHAHVFILQARSPCGYRQTSLMRCSRTRRRTWRSATHCVSQPTGFWRVSFSGSRRSDA